MQDKIFTNFMGAYQLFSVISADMTAIQRIYRDPDGISDIYILIIIPGLLISYDFCAIIKVTQSS